MTSAMTPARIVGMGACVSRVFLSLAVFFFMFNRTLAYLSLVTYYVMQERVYYAY